MIGYDSRIGGGEVIGGKSRSSYAFLRTTCEFRYPFATRPKA